MSRAGALLTALALLVAGVTGCGIPDETRVVVHGTGPPPTTQAGGESGSTPRGREAASDRATFVNDYLAAAAGDITTAVDRVRAFIAPSSRNQFRPDEELNVVRLVENPLISPGSPRVKLRVQQVGVLRQNGALEPPRTDVSEYTLVISDAAGSNSGWFVSNPPPVLLLSDTALNKHYQTRSIYFWNREHTALVPDLRYMPVAAPPEGQPNTVLKWLTDGPSPWLDPAVQSLPDDTARIGNSAVINGKLQINLTASAVPADDRAALQRLGWQLMWSMRPNLSASTALELKIANELRETFTGTNYLTSNPGYLLAQRPERFCVYDGQVRRMTNSESAASPVPLLTDKVNRRVRSAAISRSDTTAYAALVVQDGSAQSLVTGAARTGGTAEFHSAPLPAGPVSRPVWLTPATGGSPGRGTGLIAAGGRLYRYFTDINPQLVGLPSSVTGPVTAVAAAPDGLRVAIVAGGRLYAGVLVDNGAGPVAGAVREVRTSLGRVKAVDFSGETSLVVAGPRADTGRVAIVDTTVDGGLQTFRLSDLGDAEVTHLAAYPANPAATSVRSAANGDAVVTYVANNIAYDLSAQPDPIEAAEVTGVTPSPGAPVARPAAPFFLR